MSTLCVYICMVLAYRLYIPPIIASLSRDIIPFIPIIPIIPITPLVLH